LPEGIQAMTTGNKAYLVQKKRTSRFPVAIYAYGIA